MKLPEEIRRQFQEHGRAGGHARAARMSPDARRAVARRAVTARWIRERFGCSRFEDLGLPAGEIVDAGLDDLATGRETVASLLVSMAAPRLRREGVPVGKTIPRAEDRLYDLLSRTEGELAHARYLAATRRMVSFADACHQLRFRHGHASSA